MRAQLHKLTHNETNAGGYCKGLNLAAYYTVLLLQVSTAGHVLAYFFETCPSPSSPNAHCNDHMHSQIIVSKYAANSIPY